MPVTELARLRVLEDGLSADIQAKLEMAKTVMEDASGYNFHYYSCIEEPQVIYIIGAWPSIKFHMSEFIPSPANQRLLSILKEQIVVEWMLHLDIDQTKRALPLRRPTLSITRHFIKGGERDRVQKTFEENTHHAEPSVGEAEAAVGGYRLDKGFDPSANPQDDVRDEFVLFTGWNDIEHHEAFTNSCAFRQYAQIRDHLDRDAEDIKHTVRLDVTSRLSGRG